MSTSALSSADREYYQGFDYVPLLSTFAGLKQIFDKYTLESSSSSGVRDLSFLRGFVAAKPHSTGAFPDAFWNEKEDLIE